MQSAGRPSGKLKSPSGNTPADAIRWWPSGQIETAFGQIETAFGQIETAFGQNDNCLRAKRQRMQSTGGLRAKRPSQPSCKIASGFNPLAACRHENRHWSNPQAAFGQNRHWSNPTGGLRAKSPLEQSNGQPSGTKICHWSNNLAALGQNRHLNNQQAATQNMRVHHVVSF